MENRPLTVKEKIGICAGLGIVLCGLLALAMGGVSTAATNICVAAMGLSGVLLLVLVSMGLAGMFKDPSDSSPDEPED